MKGKAHMAKTIAPIHPGEILGADFLDGLGITPYRLAIDTGLPTSLVYAVLKGGRGITAQVALRLARYFGTTPEFWLNLQTRYDLERARPFPQSTLSPHETQ